MSVVTEAAWKKQREEIKTLRRENRESREKLHQQAFLIDNLQADNAELTARCWSLEERVVDQAMVIGDQATALRDMPQIRIRLERIVAALMSGGDKERAQVEEAIGRVA